MRKVVFKGIINGKEFDNVKDYNEAMSKLIAQGATSINASSETRVADEKELYEEPKTEIKEEFNLEDFLPFFDGDEYYIDKLVSPNEAETRKNINDAEDLLVNNLTKLEKVLNGKVDFDIEDAFKCVDKIKEIRTQLKRDSDWNEKATKEISDRIKTDNEKLKVLSNTKLALTLLSEYYDGVFKLIKSYLFGF